MNQFNQDISNAAAQQKRFYLSLVTLIVTVVVFVGAFAVFLKGTSVRVTPNEISKTATFEVTSGFALFMNGTLFSFTRNPEVVISNVGFETELIHISPDIEGEHLEIQLTELPATLKLKTVISSSDIIWFINDQSVAISDILDVALPAGHYRISATHKYYEPQSFDIDLGRGETVEKVLEFIPVQGRLTINRMPHDAVLFINSDKQGADPISKLLVGGLYDVSIRKNGYETIREKIAITNRNADIQRSYKLKLLQSFTAASVSPQGGRLTLSGKVIRPGAKQSILANKTYYLRYEKAGYFSSEKKIKAKPGQMQKISFKLKAEIGEITLRSSPSSAVFVNDQPVGNTPLTLRLPAITHKVDFRATGYRAVQKQIKPSGKTSLAINVSLKTVQSARRSEAKNSYQNSVGGQMLLFKPKKITLGAPRYEKGQRANEFIRKVEFSRHFYAGEKEITEHQFALFKKGANGGSKTQPASNVSWLDAVTFCNWMSENEGLSQFYKLVNGKLKSFVVGANGYRLPSEAEWEWLARKAGRNRQTKFPWGDKSIIPADAGNIADETANGTTRFYVPNYTDGFVKIAPVGSFGKDKAGLYDLFGNLSEWTHDFYSLVPPSKSTILKDPLGDRFGNKHVIKGANWSSGNLTEIRPAFRQAGNKGSKHVGFRVARYL
ncbi:hypothetical protein A9Q83_16565 [Alphaproteobacteria bacterium 46_93_T64]|nr:hypothetical protein A9Q83_16565 [Alphaproteobacteria bacterium 46_93_T64]